MPRFNHITFAYSDPGTVANAGVQFTGGPAVVVFDFSVVENPTNLKLQMSFDNSAWVDVVDITAAAVASGAQTAAFDSMFNVVLPPCYVRTNVTAGGGATTTGVASVTHAKADNDG